MTLQTWSDEVNLDTRIKEENCAKSIYRLLKAKPRFMVDYTRGGGKMGIIRIGEGWRPNVLSKGAEVS